MAKRLSKEQLETDPLLTSYYLFTSFLKRNLTAVLAATVLFVLVVGGGLFYYFHSQAQEVEAQELMVNAEQAFQRGEFETALWGDDDRLRVGLIDIINNYGRTSAGNMARYYAAVAEAELGNYDDALRFIERFDPPRGILGVGPISFHAVVLSNLGEFSRAADVFVRAAEWDVNEATTPQNLFNAAQAAMEADEIARAVQLVDRILSEYEDSQVADQARRLEGMLFVRHGS
jgi:tetratricopeptide (TPR) repeat protein